MSEMFLDKEDNYRIDEYSFANQYSTPYFQRNQAYMKKQKKRVHIYTPIGAARIDAPFYQVYQMLKVKVADPNQKKDEFEDSNFIGGKQLYHLSSTLIRFLVKVIKELRAQGIQNEDKIKQEIFGQAHQKKSVNQPQDKIKQKQKDILYSVAKDNINKSDQQIKAQFAKTPFFNQQHLAWFQEDNLFNKLEILSSERKKQRLQQLSKNLKNLWKFKLVHVKRDPQLRKRFGKYVIATDIGWEKKKNEYKECRTLSQIITFEKEHKTYLNKEDHIQRAKKLGQDIIKQIIYFQTEMSNVDFVWLNPQNVFYDDIKQQYHLSPTPALLWALGMAKQPLSMQQKFVFFTPKGIDLYAAPQTLKQMPQTSKTTVCWQLIHLLHEFNHRKHMYDNQNIVTQYDLMEKQKQFEQDYKVMNSIQIKQKNIMNVFAILVYQTINTLQKKYPDKKFNWYDHKKRPQLQDFQHFFAFKKTENSKGYRKKFQFLSVLNAQYEKLIKEDKLKLLPPIKSLIIISWIKSIRWVVVRKIFKLAESEDDKPVLSKMKQQKINLQQDLTKNLQKLDEFKLAKTTGQRSYKQQISKEKDDAIQKLVHFREKIINNESDMQSYEEQQESVFSSFLENLEKYIREDCLKKYEKQGTSNIEELYQINKIDLTISVLTRANLTNYPTLHTKLEKINSLRTSASQTSLEQLIKKFETFKKQIQSYAVNEEQAVLGKY